MGRSTNVPLFGQALPPNATFVPPLPHKLLDYFSKRGVTAEGLFRVTGNIDAVERIKKRLNKGKDVDLHEENPHVVASLLKLYFRELPEPLFTFHYYPDFVAAGELVEEEEAVAKIQKTLKDLPIANRIVAKVLFHFLDSVRQQAEENKMHASNLSIVFAPTLLKPADELAIMSGSAASSRVVELMITHLPVVFADEPDPGAFIVKGGWGKNQNKDNVLVNLLNEEKASLLRQQKGSSLSSSDHPGLQVLRKPGPPPRPPRRASTNTVGNALQPAPSREHSSPQIALRPGHGKKARPFSTSMSGNPNSVPEFQKPHPPPRFAPKAPTTRATNNSEPSLSHQRTRPARSSPLALSSGRSVAPNIVTVADSAPPSPLHLPPAPRSPVQERKPASSPSVRLGSPTPPPRPPRS